VERSAWTTTWRYAAGIAGCALLAWFTLRTEPVPLLWRVDLGFHELGHFLTYWLPDLGTALMGSVFQVLIPLGLAAYFSLRRKDLVGTGLCTAWAGASLQGVSVYVADAPFRLLPLLGGEHDWAFILGPAELDALDAAPELALAMRVMAILLVLAGGAVCLWRLLRRDAEPGPSLVVGHSPHRAHPSSRIVRVSAATLAGRRCTA
jgi:hypothetical protein